MKLCVSILPTLFQLKSTCTFLREDFFHPTDDAVCQANLNPVRMCGRLCKNILNDPFRQFPGALVLFPDNLDPGSRFSIRPVSSTHFCRRGQVCS
jgi:hypothetical protein